MTPVYFWQAMISPHMAGLARALAEQGQDVTYCAAMPISDGRAAMGWKAAELGHAKSLPVVDEAAVAHAVAAAPAGAVHLVEGIRPHGAVAAAHRLLAKRGARIWWMGEELDMRGFKGSLRASYYRWFARQRSHRAEAVLAIGERMQALMANAGFAPEAIHPFTYFLEGAHGNLPAPSDAPFTILFVGQMIPRKRFDLLLAALSGLEDAGLRLEVVGDGALAGRLKKEALEQLGADRVRWHGSLPMSDTRQIIAHADLLVLPSDHDGWGAVVSEAFLEGTPAICSEGCGAREIVRHDGGIIFPKGDVEALRAAIASALARGKVSAADRDARRLRHRGLTVDAGARYLSGLIEGRTSLPPWRQSATERQAA